MNELQHCRRNSGTDDQDYESQARDTFSFRDSCPENRGKKNACMAAEGSRAVITHWNQEKSGGGRWKEGARLGPEATTNSGTLTQPFRRLGIGAIQESGNAVRQAVTT